MPKPLTSLSIMWPSTFEERQYLLHREVDIVVFGRTEKTGDKFMDLQTLRAKILFIDEKREAFSLELWDKTTLKLAQNRGQYWGKSEGKASERGYYDIRMRRATSQEEAVVNVLEELSTAEHLIHRIALVREEMHNAFGEIVLRNPDTPTLTRGLRATKYLAALIELALDLAKEKGPLLSGEVDAIVILRLEKFVDLVADPRVLSG